MAVADCVIYVPAANISEMKGNLTNKLPATFANQFYTGSKLH